jgi:hypothetical protein
MSPPPSRPGQPSITVSHLTHRTCDADDQSIAAAPHYLIELMLRHGIAARDANSHRSPKMVD